MRQTTRYALIMILYLGVFSPILAGQWETLQKVGDFDFFSLAYVSTNEGFAVGSDPFDYEKPGAIGHTTDGGKTWEKVENTAFESDLKSVFFINKKNGWAVGARGLIVATTDGGKSWEPQTSKVGNGLSDVCFLTPKTGFVAGEGETVLKTTNGGKKWTILSGGSQASGFGDDDTSVFSAIQFVDENTGWVAGVRITPSTQGQETLIQKTVDGGQTWVKQPTNTEDILEDIYFVNATTGWAVGENGVIFATTDGETWKALSSGSEEKLRSVRFIDTETGWAVGGDMGVNVILHTTDGGQNWADQSSGKLFAYDIFSLDDNHIWLTGQNAIIMKYAK